MSNAPGAHEAADDAADARAIDVAEAADASEAALAEALADAPVVQVEDAVGLARLRLLGDEPAPFEADLPEARVAVEDSDNAVLRSGLGRLDARETGAPRLRPPRAGGGAEGAAGRRGLPGTGPGRGEETSRLTFTPSPRRKKLARNRI